MSTENVEKVAHEIERWIAAVAADGSMCGAAAQECRKLVLGLAPTTPPPLSGDGGERWTLDDARRLRNYYVSKTPSDGDPATCMLAALEATFPHGCTLAPSQGTAVTDDDRHGAFSFNAALHPDTANLVATFAGALAAKLYAAQLKYGYSDGWASNDWMDECRAKLVEHVAKGDPRDAAAYCAFLWHHGEKTIAPRSLMELRAQLGPETALASPAVRDERVSEIELWPERWEEAARNPKANETAMAIYRTCANQLRDAIARTHQKVAAAGQETFEDQATRLAHESRKLVIDIQPIDWSLVATPASILAAEDGGGAVAWRKLNDAGEYEFTKDKHWCEHYPGWEPLYTAPSQAGVREVSAGAIEWPSIDDVCAAAMREDAEFSTWRNSVPDKHWARLDLSALRVGYELGSTVMRRLFENDDRARKEVKP